MVLLEDLYANSCAKGGPAMQYADFQEFVRKFERAVTPQLFAKVWQQVAEVGQPTVSLTAFARHLCPAMLEIGRGDDAVGSPHRAPTSRFEFLELFFPY